MPVSPLVLELLEKAAESGLSAEEACKDSPHLIEEVRACLRHLSSVRDELDALFPEELESPGPSSPRPEIPGYRVGDIVGRGGMGVVYRAHHLRLNRPVALKMMLNGGFAGPPELARFQQEAEALAALQHPNIVQLFDVGESEGLPYFTMEFLAGGNLAQRLGGVPLSARDAASLMIAMADAIESAHRGGIVHRDLKPSNILLTTGGTPKVTDFGLARRLEAGVDLSMTGMRIGTPGYMAPEQVAGHVRVSGAAADVYSLGAIFYEMLTGRPPFRAETAAETERQVVVEEPAPPSRLNARIPRDLETICLKCLQKEPRKRFSSAADLGEDIGRFLRGEPIKARPASAVDRAGKWVRRHPARAVTLVGGITISVAMLVAGWWLMSARASLARSVEEDLQIANQSLRKSEWAVARSALERARGRLGAGGPGELSRRLDQVGRDLNLAGQLSDIRLERISRAGWGGARSAVEYEKAFRGAGLLEGDEPARVTAARLRHSHIMDALVAAIDDWALCAHSLKDARRETWLLEVARRADPDPHGWRDRLRDPSARRDRQELTRLAASEWIAESPVNLLVSLGELLQWSGGDAASFLLSVQHDHPDDLWVNYILSIHALHRNDLPEALRNLQAALAIRPGASLINHDLGEALYRADRRDESFSYYAKAVQLDPEDARIGSNYGHCLLDSGRLAQAAEQFKRGLESTDDDSMRLLFWKSLRRCEFRAGNLADAEVWWGKVLATKPRDHSDWDGYAECCLYLGHTEAYRAACRELVNQFRTAEDAQIAERTGRACLLMPISGDLLSDATSLIDRALADKQPKAPWLPSYFMVAKGLSEYRHGRLESAISIMEGPASPALQPIPRLVSAMALHRLGRKDEALKTLQEAIRAGDWEKSHANDREKWMYHILRREAEAMMLPSLSGLMEGKYSSRTNDEWLCLLGVCQCERRCIAAAGL